ncbi:HAD domain-containing protein [uncultured Tenacibaculum sp.]|uniref:HAD domain-containing protein n=1 Tax=uncultured Tenacibaculum sp. TaxID=174713 RepID=UPI00261329AD|nr:HAD domain-containing protein [uncultured Tenacibaculum sp.]
MKKVLILDLDGVLITTPPWKSDTIHIDGYSDFNQNCVSNLNKLLEYADIEIWLSSTRRLRKTLSEFNQIFRNRKIQKEISGFLPAYENCKNRREEVLRFLLDYHINDFIILDDDKSLNSLKEEIKQKLILTELTIGFNSEKLKEALVKLK